MADVYISFYLKANRIHIFMDTLRSIGSPKRICFMIEENGRTLLIAPYAQKDFKSHEVPDPVLVEHFCGCTQFRSISQSQACMRCPVLSWQKAQPGDMIYGYSGKP